MPYLLTQVDSLNRNVNFGHSVFGGVLHLPGGIVPEADPHSLAVNWRIRLRSGLMDVCAVMTRKSL